MKLKFFSCLLRFLPLSLFCSLSFAVSLNHLVVFGDSLSDNGNLYKMMGIPGEPYYQGRFSNGPVWAEQLLDVYYGEQATLHLKDFAYGGAGIEDDGDEIPVLTLKHQVDEFLSAEPEPIDPNNLYVVWIGANNYFILNDQSSTDDIEKVAHTVTYGIQKQLRRLADKGAKYVLVINVPDLGKTPSAQESQVQTRWTQATLRHNELLDMYLAELGTEYPDVQWMQFDAKNTFDKVVAMPEAYGFTNVTASCIDLVDGEDKALQTNPIQMARHLSQAHSHSPTLMKKAKACDTYLFYDAVHSTTAGHEVLALQILRHLESQGVILGAGFTNPSVYKYIRRP